MDVWESGDQRKWIGAEKRRGGGVEEEECGGHGGDFPIKSRWSSPAPASVDKATFGRLDVLAPWMGLPFISLQCPPTSKVIK